MENIKQALQSLRASKMRAFLTMLGIIIGTASVIGISSLGDSMIGTVNGQMAGMGVNNINISVREKESTGNARQSLNASTGVGGRSAKDSDLISASELDEMMGRFVDDVDMYSVSESVGVGQARKEDAYANISVTGVNPGYGTVSNVEMLQGRFIDDTDNNDKKSVCVVSDFLAEKIFGTENPVGKKVRIYLDSHVKQYTIVGVYRYEESMFMGGMSSQEDKQTSFYIPVTTAKAINKGNKNYSQITILPKEEGNVADITQELSNYWAARYSDNNYWTANVSNMESQLETVTDMMGTITLAISVIAGISLLVGGIGVMNIMLVSVTERTHEIGVRKALGALKRQIQMQFITESAIISLLGGIIGILFGLLLGYLGAMLLGSTMTINVTTVLGTVAFSIFIGIFFGVYPANKAAKLDPIDALRYE